MCGRATGSGILSWIFDKLGIPSRVELVLYATVDLVKPSGSPELAPDAVTKSL